MTLRPIAWRSALATCFFFSCSTSEPTGSDAMAADLGACEPVDSAFGFGLGAEGQCAPDDYQGAGTVIDVSTVVSGSVDYYIGLTDAAPVEGCLYEPRVWISTEDELSPGLPFVVGDRVMVDFRTVTELEGRNLFVYVTVTDEGSGSLLYMHHHFDDRFFEDGHLRVADTFDIRLDASCEVDAGCYEQSLGHRIQDPQWNLDVGEYESTSVTAFGMRFGLRDHRPLLRRLDAPVSGWPL